MSKSSKSPKLAVAVERRPRRRPRPRRPVRPAIDGRHARRLAPVGRRRPGAARPRRSDAADRLRAGRRRRQERLADLTETVATKLDERLPDDKTPAGGRQRGTPPTGSPGQRQAQEAVLLVAGLGAGAAASSPQAHGWRQLAARQWQSTTPARHRRPRPRTPPVTAATAGPPPRPAPPPGRPPLPPLQAGRRPSRRRGRGLARTRWLADATETAHVPTTPDAPASVIDVRE